MRFTLPMMVAAAVVLPAAGAAQAHRPQHPHRAPKRVKADLTLHVSGHNVLSGKDLLVSGRVTPSPGRNHRVRVVVDGPSGGQVRTTTDRNGGFRAHWGLHSVGIYEIRAYGVHDRRVSGSASKPAPAPLRSQFSALRGCRAVVMASNTPVSPAGMPPDPADSSTRARRRRLHREQPPFS